MAFLFKKRKPKKDFSQRQKTSRKIFTIFLLGFFGFSLIEFPSTLRAGGGNNITNPNPKGPAKSGEIIVKVKDKNQFLKKGVGQKLSVLKAVEPGKKTKNKEAYLKIKISGQENLESKIAELKKDPNVIFAEPNYVFKTAVVPNDPYFSQQWGLSKIKASEAWNIEKGREDVVIAVIDTGVNFSHPDLAGRIWINIGEYGDGKENNGIDDDGNGYIDDWRGWDFVSANFFEVAEGEDPGPQDNNPSDFHGHGTAVAGVLGAATNNNIGIAGVTWNNKIMVLRAGYKGADGGGYFDLIDLAEAIIYAADMQAKVINLSLGSGEESQILKEAVEYAFQKGSIIVAAAGNDNSNLPFYPAAWPEVIAVGAIDENGVKASFSNYGLWVDIYAPGTNILTTSNESRSNEAGYAFASGTSFAAPFVTGGVALFLSAYPSSTFEEVLNYLVQTSFKNSFNQLTINSLNFYNYITKNILPDYYLESFFLPSGVVLGGETQVSFTIYNNTTQSIYFQRVSIGVRLNDSLNRDYPADFDVTINPGQKYTFSKVKIFKESGKYLFWPIALTQEGKWISLSDSTGNIPKSVCVSNFPLLEIKQTINLSPQEPLNYGAGQEICFNFILKNTYNVSLVIDRIAPAVRYNSLNRDFGSQLDVKINPGEEKTFSFKNWFSEEGDYYSFIAYQIGQKWINPQINGIVPRTYFRVGPPKVALISSLSMNVKNPALGQEVEFSYKIKNLHQSNLHLPIISVGIRLNTYLNRDLPGEQVILASGEEFLYQKTKVFKEKGSYRAWIIYWTGKRWYGLGTNTYFNIWRYPSIYLVQEIQKNPSLPEYSLGTIIEFDYMIKNNESTSVVLDQIGLACRLNQKENRDFGFAKNVKIDSGQNYFPQDALKEGVFKEFGDFNGWVAIQIGNDWFKPLTNLSNSFFVKINKFPDIKVVSFQIAPELSLGQTSQLFFRVHNFSQEKIQLDLIGPATRLNNQNRDFGFAKIILFPEDNDSTNLQDEYIANLNFNCVEDGTWRFWIAALIGKNWWKVSGIEDVNPEVIYLANKIRVGIVSCNNPIITSTSKFYVFRSNGSKETYNEGEQTTLKNSGDWSFAENGILKILSPSLSFSEYRGILKYQYSNSFKAFWLVNEVYVEDYVKGSYEEPESWMQGYSSEVAMNAWKAHVVAFRTYGLRRKMYPVCDVFDLYADSRSQSYGGYTTEKNHPTLVLAVQATKGYVAIYNNQPILAAYFGRCGGSTETYWDPVNYPYLKAVSDIGFHYDNNYNASSSHHYGMCMVGCKTRAILGYSWENILKSYYFGIEIKKIY